MSVLGVSRVQSQKQCVERYHKSCYCVRYGSKLLNELCTSPAFGYESLSTTKLFRCPVKGAGPSSDTTTSESNIHHQLILKRMIQLKRNCPIQSQIQAIECSISYARKPRGTNQGTENITNLCMMRFTMCLMFVCRASPYTECEHDKNVC